MRLRRSTEKKQGRARIYYRRVCSSLLQQQLPAMLCRRSRTVMSVASRAGTVTTAPTMNNLLLLRAVIIFHIILYVVYYTVLPTVSYNHGYNITGQWEKFGHLPPAHRATAAADLRPPCRAHSSALLNGLFGKPSPIPIRLPRRTQLSTFRRAPTAAVRRSLTVVCVRVLCRVRGARLCNM